MGSETARLRLKTWMFVPLVVLANAVGDFCMKRGMPASLETPAEYAGALFQPWVALGVALLIVWQLSRMALLSWADLSYVVPVTAVGYAVVALLGRVFLHERITAARWVGIALIVAGVALVGGGTEPQTTGSIHGRGAQR
jgi:drug/metabolite transporter (DMT)-like permease